MSTSAFVYFGSALVFQWCSFCLGSVSLFLCHGFGYLFLSLGSPFLFCVLAHISLSVFVFPCSLVLRCCSLFVFVFLLFCFRLFGFLLVLIGLALVSVGLVQCSSGFMFVSSGFSGESVQWFHTGFILVSYPTYCGVFPCPLDAQIYTKLLTYTSVYVILYVFVHHVGMGAHRNRSGMKPV